MRWASTSRVGRAVLILALAGALLSTACQRQEVQQGAALFVEHCARCHGAEGVGQNPARPWGSLDPVREGFVAPALDGRGHCWQHTRAELVALIRNGSPVPGSPMRAAPQGLSERDVEAIVRYLETLWPRALRELNRRLTEEGRGAK